MKFVFGINECEVAWWPPPVGARLRRRNHHQIPERTDDIYVRSVAALHTVLAVFKNPEENIGPLVVAAEWLPGRHRWVYHVFDVVEAHLGVIWRDEDPAPDDAKDLPKVPP